VYLETWLGLLADMMDQKPSITIFGRGENPINFVSVRDVAALVAFAVRSDDCNRKVMEIGGPDNLTLNQLADRLPARRETGGAIDHVPRVVLRAVATLLRPIKPTLATLAQFGLVMDTTDMTIAADTARATVPELPVTRLDDLLDITPGRSSRR
jgi:nucleoside-diphosphate-sugar epimerase